MTWAHRVVLVAILAAAAGFRLIGLDWDGFHHHHPDERYITWVATTIEFPSPLGTDWRTSLDPTTSSFNPFHWPPGASSEGIVVLQDQPRDFAYGHVPLYLGVLATRLVERIAPVVGRPGGWLSGDVLNSADRVELHHLAAVGRALTAVVDVATVLITFLLGRQLFGVGAGLLAAALMASAVLSIQLAHFFTSDPYLTFFAAAAVLFLVHAHQKPGSSPARRWAYLLLASAAVGLAIGSKFSGIILLLPLAWTAWRSGQGSLGSRFGRIAVAWLFVGILFVLTNPFAVLDNTCEVEARPVTVRNCYLANVLEQNAMVSGRADQAFARQYDGTVPFLYLAEMQWRWGLGPLLTIASLIGLAWACIGVFRSLGQEGEPLNDAVVAVLLWIVPTLILTGAFHAKFLRYLLPVTPQLVVLAAGWLLSLRNRRLRRVAAGSVLLASALWALAFAGIYRQPHPWNEASAWIYRNVPPGSLILSEQWDDYLPVTTEVDGRARQRGEFRNAELTWLSGPDEADNETKLRANLDLLAEADYLTVLSNRVYGVVPRLAERYPLSSQIHPLLFDGRLGYELVWVGGRYPNLAGFEFRPDSFGWSGLRPPGGVAEYLQAQPGLTLGRADESFTVYDQPLTMIFRNTGRLSTEQLRGQLSTP